MAANKLALKNKTWRFSGAFTNRKIGTKIIFGFACVLTITAAISAGAFVAFGRADAGLDNVVRASTNLRKATELEGSFIDLRASIRAYAFTGHAANRDQAKAGIATVADSLRKLVESINDPSRKNAAQELAKQFENIVNPFPRLVDLREQQNQLTVKVLAPGGDQLRLDFVKLRDIASKDADASLLARVNDTIDVLMQMRIESVKFNSRHDKIAEENVEKLYGELTKRIATLDQVIKPDGRKLYDNIKGTLAKYRDGYTQGGRASKEQRELEGGIEKSVGVIDTELTALKKSILNNATTTVSTTRNLMADTSNFILIAAIGGLLLGGVLAVIIGRVISRPIVALVPELQKLADGNFNVTIPGLGRRDEVGQIGGAVALMAEKVSATIAEIKASGREVTNASAEISTSTTDLSQRTEEQAASLEQTSAAMEELSATVKKNSENAQLANTDANNTCDVADRGGKVVAKAVEAMAKIEESSRKISDIIGVIDEIARQTNLLALNAAVEAARAGEAGRGFAVVASEVRSLAQRSSQAAKDIKDLITNSNGQVKDGVELVNKAGESLNEIVESIKKVASVVSDIANASIEQATGIDEINRALNQMDEVTQQNSALVEENAATAKTLEHQARQMDERVAFFQIAVGDNSHAGRGASDKPHGITAARPSAAVPAKPAPVAKKPAPAAPVQRAAAGSARQMQTALATAVNAGNDWKEF
jgi:methyl-accepting chemotaxis protein